MSGLNVTVLRGSNQIGGNLIQVSCGGTRILLDAGGTLDGDDSIPPQAAWLTEPGGCDAILLTHTHPDHAALVSRAAPDIPVYVGRGAWEVQRAADWYLGKSTREPAGFLVNQRPLRIGELTVVPFLCDHSAFDSYMLLVKGAGESLLYTGDFRGHGRKSFEALLRRLPDRVDCLVCEGTSLSRTDREGWSEADLENLAADWMDKYPGPALVLQSAANLDRLVTFYRAAACGGRILLEDLYQAVTAAAAGPSFPQPGPSYPRVRVFLSAGCARSSPRFQKFATYGAARMRREQIPRESLLCVRASMLPWIERLARRVPLRESVLFYSLWSGYREQPEMARFLGRCQELGIRIVPLHSSGHAAPAEIRRLMERVHPRRVLPVHTLCPEWFPHPEKSEQE